MLDRNAMKNIIHIQTDLYYFIMSFEMQLEIKRKMTADVWVISRYVSNGV